MRHTTAASSKINDTFYVLCIKHIINSTRQFYHDHMEVKSVGP